MATNTPNIPYAGPTTMPGPRGPPGDKGDQGPPGEKGDKGDPAGNSRKLLAANATYYIAEAGSDYNAGTQAKPWATVQKGFDFVSMLDFGGHDVELSVGAGEFRGGTLTSTVGGGTLQVNGAGSGLTTINTLMPYLSGLLIDRGVSAQVGFNNLKILLASNGVGLTLRGAGVCGGFGCVSDVNAVVDVVFENEGAVFSAVTVSGGAELRDHGYQGAVTVNQTGYVGANGFSFLYMELGARFYNQVAWDFAGTPNDYGIVAWLTDVASSLHVVYPTPFTGSAIGQRFILAFGSNVDSSSSGLNMFPGDKPGVWDASSSYDGVPGAASKSLTDQRRKNLQRMREILR